MRTLHLNIRTKLFVSYSLAFLLILVVIGLGIYFFLRMTITRNIESELEQSTTILRSMVETAAEVSLKNYLRAVAEKNLDVVQYYHQRFMRGELSEKEAKEEVAALLLTQRIGVSGYLYIINSAGILQAHPEPSLVGVDISAYDFVNEQKRRKQGYLLYDWQNPGEASPRPKALYMTYFQPWDWIISVTSYRSEFKQLVKVDDFREKIISLTFGQTGYSYVMDLEGNLILHPRLEGHNILGEKDAQGRYFIREICNRRQGKIIYPWKNPGEKEPREKLVIFKYIPQFEWIVASSSYLNEFYAPLNVIRTFLIWAMIAALLLLIPLTLAISRTITTPLQDLMDHFAKMPDGDFTSRIARRYSGEIGKLAGYFNLFMTRLERYSNDLRSEIDVRTRAELALRQSEEMFSKAFSLCPIGILIISYPQGKVITVNDSFVKSTGFPRETLLVRSLFDLDIMTASDILSLQQQLGSQETVCERAITFHTAGREMRQALLSADLIELWGGTYVLTVLEDVTERQQLQERILDISETERRKIGQDIHDDLCPHLIGTEVMAGVLRRKLTEMLPEAVEPASKICSLIREAISKSRHLARGLCPVFLVDRGLEAALTELAVKTGEVYGLSCIFVSHGHLAFSNNGDITQVFLIIQEAVNNSVRHAAANRIVIRQKQHEGKMQLVVEDDGIGIARSAHSSGLGLKIMRYRADRIGASLDIQPLEPRGTRVTLALKGVSLAEE